MRIRKSLIVANFVLSGAAGNDPPAIARPAPGRTAMSSSPVFYPDATAVIEVGDARDSDVFGRLYACGRDKPIAVANTLGAILGAAAAGFVRWRRTGADRDGLPLGEDQGPCPRLAAWSQLILSLVFATGDALRAQVGPGPIITDDHPRIEYFLVENASRIPLGF